MDAANLHPWAWENGKSYWNTGHFHQAVMQAAKIFTGALERSLTGFIRQSAIPGCTCRRRATEVKSNLLSNS